MRICERIEVGITTAKKESKRKNTYVSLALGASLLLLGVLLLPICLSLSSTCCPPQPSIDGPWWIVFSILYSMIGLGSALAVYSIVIFLKSGPGRWVGANFSS